MLSFISKIIMIFPQLTLTLGLRIGSFLIFLGRAYQYLFWDAPFRVLLWDESLMTPILQSFIGISWHDFSLNTTIDQNIQCLIQANGVLFLLAAGATLCINRRNKPWARIPISLGIVSLLFLFLLLYKQHHFQLGMLMEHTVQLGVPVLLLYFLQTQKKSSTLWLMKILIATTFVGHGLYAVGYYFVPNHFINLMVYSIGVNETTSKWILFVAGILDFVVAFAIFFPKLTRIFLLYAFVWGTLTAFARIVAGFDLDFPLQTLHQEFYKVIYRLPHGLLPLWALIIGRK